MLRLCLESGEAPAGRTDTRTVNDKDQRCGGFIARSTTPEMIRSFRTRRTVSHVLGALAGARSCGNAGGTGRRPSAASHQVMS
jgi:hypothetical protein